MGFKNFLDAAERGETHNELFITPSAGVSNYDMQALMDQAHERGLNPTKKDRTIAIPPAFALFRVAHPFLPETLRGTRFHAIHGMEHLDGYEGSDLLKLRLEALIR